MLPSRRSHETSVDPCCKRVEAPRAIFGASDLECLKTAMEMLFPSLLLSHTDAEVPSGVCSRSCKYMARSGL